MKISDFTIQNHSRISDCTDIEVRDNLILVGPNDVGKSSVLRCLDLCLGASSAQLYSSISDQDFRDTSQPLVVQVRMSDFSPAEKAAFPDEILVDVTTTAVSLTVRLEANVETDSGALQIRRYSPSAGHSRQLSRDQLESLGWRMISATQTPGREIRNHRDASLDGILAEIDLGDETDVFLGLTEKFQTQLGSSQVLSNLRTKLSGHLSKALPTEIKQSDLAFVANSADPEKVFNDVRLQVTRDGRPKNLGEQSDGTRALYAMALYDLASSSANIVAIDEPELHLHPASQRSLAKLILGEGNQKIVVTHSADIVGMAEPENIVTVRRGGSLVQPKRGFLSKEYRLLTRWWIHDKLEPLTARHLLVVEGISDRIVVSRCAQLTNLDLDRFGVSLIQAQGSGEMKPILALFGKDGFCIEMSILIDKDAEIEVAKLLEIEPRDLESQDVFVSDADLEEEYTEAIGPSVLFGWLEESGLFSSNELSNCATTGPGGTKSDMDVAGFCRRQSDYKTRAAIVVADRIDASTASRIASVNRLLAALRRDLIA